MQLGLYMSTRMSVCGFGAARHVQDISFYFPFGNRDPLRSSGSLFSGPRELIPQPQSAALCKTLGGVVWWPGFARFATFIPIEKQRQAAHFRLLCFSDNSWMDSNLFENLVCLICLHGDMYNCGPRNAVFPEFSGNPDMQRDHLVKCVSLESAGWFGV